MSNFSSTASSPTVIGSGSKRRYYPDDRSAPTLPATSRSRPPPLSPTTSANASATGNGSTAYSAFRNVSACNRCRLRKNRCDQRLPQCRSCEKAGVHCVGYDPSTKREIPRSYTFFLESRVAYLEKHLRDHNITFRPGQAYEGERDPATAEGEGAKAVDVNSPGANGRKQGVRFKAEADQDGASSALSPDSTLPASTSGSRDDGDRKQRLADEETEERKLDNLVSNIGMVSVQGASDPRYLGSTSGISFARVVFAALRTSVLSGSASERGSTRPSEPRFSAISASEGGSSMRESFFGLQTRPTMKQAPFPDRTLAERLVNLYFEHANPQIPILHRGEFMELFERIYSEGSDRTAKDMYTLNIVCAIGAGIIFDTKNDASSQDQMGHNQPSHPDTGSRSPKRRRVSHEQSQPEEYHASAVMHLERFLCSTSSDAACGGLEELQAVLLLASFALLRPVAPGLWYIVGVAVRLALDLGLHYEDGSGMAAGDENQGLHRTAQKGEDSSADSSTPQKLKVDSRDRGRRQWIRDLRRRLFWCVYSFDRLVSTCVGRPFGFTDEVITTEFPSLLDDRYITKSGFLTPPAGDDAPSYKRVAHHYFKLRMLQSEIQQVLQYQQAKMVRQASHHRRDSYLRGDLESSFLRDFESFRSWRQDIQRRLDEWRESAPKPEQIGVRFSVEFLELNYWQALIMLYRQSLTVPAPLASELTPTEDISSPRMTSEEDDSEDEDDIYLKVAEAGQKVLRLYRQLHCVRLVNYTYLATHHLFMAGISFLYAIWHSPLVRMRLTFDDVDFTVYSAISVLTDLMEKCPPAEACRDAFDRMSKATIKMCLSTTGFGANAEKGAIQPSPPSGGQNIPRKIAQVQTTGDFDPSEDAGNITPRQENHHEPIPPQRAARRVDNSNNNDWEESSAFLNAKPRSEYEMDYSPTSQQQMQQTPQYTSSQPQFSVPASAVLPVSQAQNYNFYPPSRDQHGSQPYYFSDLFRNLQQQQQNSSQPLAQQPDQSLLNLPDLDFLDFPNNFQSAEHPNYSGFSGSGTTSNVDADADMLASIPPFDPARANGTGLDLRFGLGADYQHDWGDGGGIDLMDGFFFGTGGGYNGYGV